MADQRDEVMTVMDIGGTHLRWAWWSPGLGLGEVSRAPSPSHARLPDADVDELQSMLVRDIAALVPSGGVAGVSFGAAMNHRTGTAYASAPLWGPRARAFDVHAALRSARPDVSWHVINDVTAALLHFTTAPRVRDRRKVLLATVSTGVACRVMDMRTGDIPVDGGGLQGEIGHLPAAVTLDGAPVGLRCDCGHAGHVAAVSSGPGIRRLAEVLRSRRPEAWRSSALGHGLTRDQPFEQVFLAALDAGDPVAAELLDVATRPIADIVRTALCLDPDIDLVGITGGVAVNLGRHYHASLLGHLRRQGLYLTSEQDPTWLPDRVTVCTVGEANGLVGAGLAALAAGRRRDAAGQLVRS